MRNISRGEFLLACIGASGCTVSSGPVPNDSLVEKHNSSKQEKTTTQNPIPLEDILAKGSREFSFQTEDLEGRNLGSMIIYNLSSSVEDYNLELELSDISHGGLPEFLCVLRIPKQNTNFEFFLRYSNQARDTERTNKFADTLLATTQNNFGYELKLNLELTTHDANPKIYQVREVYGSIGLEK